MSGERCTRARRPVTTIDARKVAVSLRKKRRDWCKTLPASPVDTGVPTTYGMFSNVGKRRTGVFARGAPGGRTVGTRILRKV